MSGSGLGRTVKKLRGVWTQAYAKVLARTPDPLLHLRIAVKKEMRRLTFPAYEASLARDLRGKPQPRHVAVMCDGNRRWAREAGFLDVGHGHREGAQKISELVQWCGERGIELVTVYLLSTENLQRDPAELELLCDIIGDVSDSLAQPTMNVRLRIVGHRDLLPGELRERLAINEQATAEHTGVTVNIAVGYGGRQEILDAVRAVVRDEIAQGTAIDDLADAITQQSISDHLYTSGQPDPDLVIRTSGEQRLSGFLLWQSAYSEIWFTDTYWPAFRKVDFLRALRDFSRRSRRFGK